MCYCWTEEVCFQKAAPASLRMNVTVFREGERALLFLAIANCHLCMGKGMWLLVVPGKPHHHLHTALLQPGPALYFCRWTSVREFTFHRASEFTGSICKYCLHFTKIKWPKTRGNNILERFICDSVRNNTLNIISFRVLWVNISLRTQ